MKMRIVLLLFLFDLVASSCYAQSWPMVIANTTQSSGSSLEIRNSTGMSYSNITTIQMGKRLVTSTASSGQTVTSLINGQSTSWWYQVDLPGSTGPVAGYLAAGSTFTNPECSAGYIQVTYSTVNLRPSAGDTTSYVLINGGNGHVYQNQKFAVTSSTSISGVTWYEIDLPDECSQTSGWVASYSGSTQLVSYGTSGTNGLPAPVLSYSTVTSNSALLDWTMTIQPSGSTNTSFSIFRNGSFVGTNTTAPPDSYTDAPLSGGTTYSYYITASYSGCSLASQSNTIPITTPNGCSAPVISSGPLNQSVTAPNSASFSVSASGGTSPYTYQWQYNMGGTWQNVPNNSPYSGITSSTLNISNTTTTMNGYQYQCIVYSGSPCGSYFVTSNAATLTVNGGCSAPVIQLNPSNQNVVAPVIASFEVSATGGTTPYTYQWEYYSGSSWTNVPSGSPYSGITSSTLTINPSSIGMNGSQYRCVVYSGSPCNTYSTTTSTATLTVSTGCTNVSIASNLSSQSVTAGSAAIFSVSATGTTPFTYQWQENGSDLTNSGNTVWTTIGTTSTLTVSNITTNMDGYQYRCVVSNSCPSSQTSNAGVLMVGSSSTPSQITITNIIQNNVTFPSSLTLWSGYTNQTPNTIKICADASRATYMTFINNTGINSNNIRFWIASDPYGFDSDISGYFINYQVNGNIITAIYNHPKYSNASTLFRSDNIKIVDYTNSTSTIFTIPIQIYRAPVIMVHGLWSSPSKFNSMQTSLYNSGLYESSLISEADYHSTNSSSFAINSQVVPNEINYILNKARMYGFSAGKVDIIAHSMGGNLARIYLQSVPFQQKQDIHKIITINTPHSGSQFGNFLTNHICDEALAAQHFIDYAYLPLMDYGNTIADGACADLSVNSNAMNSLNIDNLNDGIVPCHSIVTEDNCNNIASPFLCGAYSILSDVHNCNVVSGANNFVSLIFNNDPSDLIVAVPSQEGGLPSDAISPPINSQEHIGSESNPSVINEVINALSINPDSSYFAQNGYSPAQLSSVYKLPEEGNPSSQIINGSIHIIYPSSEQAFHSGETVPVAISSANGINRTILVGFSCNDNFFLKDTLFSNGEINYTVPDDAFGKVAFIVYGYDTTTGLIDFDTVTIKIYNTASLDSIKTYPDTIYAQVNDIASISLTAYFSNGYNYPINTLNGVLYQIADTNIAAPYYQDFLEGKQIGSTTLTATYLGQTKQIPIIVIPQDTTIHIPTLQTLNIASNIQSNYPLKLYPNPNNGQFTIQFQANIGEQILYEVYNAMGQKIFTEEENALSKKITKNISLNQFVSGVYYLQVLTKTNNFYAKIVLINK